MIVTHLLYFINTLCLFHKARHCGSSLGVRFFVGDQMNNTVIIRECEDYDPEKIEAIVSDGMERLGYKPSGKVFAVGMSISPGRP